MILQDSLYNIIKLNLYQIIHYKSKLFCLQYHRIATYAALSVCVRHAKRDNMQNSRFLVIITTSEPYISRTTSDWPAPTSKLVLILLEGNTHNFSCKQLPIVNISSLPYWMVRLCQESQWNKLSYTWNTYRNTPMYRYIWIESTKQGSYHPDNQKRIVTIIKTIMTKSVISMIITTFAHLLPTAV